MMYLYEGQHPKMQYETPVEIDNLTKPHSLLSNGRFLTSSLENGERVLRVVNHFPQLNSSSRVFSEPIRQTNVISTLELTPPRFLINDSESSLPTSIPTSVNRYTDYDNLLLLIMLNNPLRMTVLHLPSRTREVTSQQGDLYAINKGQDDLILSDGYNCFQMVLLGSKWLRLDNKQEDSLTLERWSRLVILDSLANLRAIQVEYIRETDRESCSHAPRIQLTEHEKLIPSVGTHGPSTISLFFLPHSSATTHYYYTLLPPPLGFSPVYRIPSTTISPLVN